MKRIMVPTDFSNGAFQAAKLGALIAKRCGGKLLLFHAQEVVAHTEIPQKVRDSYTKSVLAECEHLLQELSKRLRAEISEIGNIETVAIIGEPTHAIAEYCSTWNADLLVVGGQGADADPGKEFGSVAEHVVRTARCPVLVSRLGQPKTLPSTGAFQHPVVAVDYSDYSLPAVAAAAALTEQGKTIELVHVFYTPGIRDEAQIVEYLSSARTKELEQLEEFAARIDQAPVAVRLFSEGFRVADQLLSYAGDSDTDLLILGARQKRDGQAILGRVTNRILRRSPVPVLVIPETVASK